MAIQGQLPKVLPMIGVPDGGMGGRHSLSTSPMSSAHSRDRHREGSFGRFPLFCSLAFLIHNSMSWSILSISICGIIHRFKNFSCMCGSSLLYPCAACGFIGICLWSRILA